MTANLDRLKIVLEGDLAYRDEPVTSCQHCGFVVNRARGQSFVERFERWNGPVVAVMHFDCYIEALSGGTL